MDEIRNRIIDISNEYEVTEKTIYSYLNILLKYPCVREGTTEKLLDCLEEIISDRISAMTNREDNTIYRNTKDTIQEMLWRTYEHSALKDMDKAYIRFRGLAGELIEKDVTVVVFLNRDIDKDGLKIFENEIFCILGANGSGKTTLLRDISREIAYRRTTVVLDERGELFPNGFERGRRMDVLSNCPKAVGIDMAIRTMGPEVIALDEITLEADCRSMIHASHCGVDLLATAHAFSVDDLKNRSIYRKLLESHIFQNVLVLRKDKSCSLERICEWN